MVNLDSARRRAIVHDDNSFFLLRNLLVNQSGDNLIIITMLSPAGPTSKFGPYPRLSPSLVLVQTTCSGLGPLQPFFVSTSLGRHIKQHPQSCSTRTCGHLYGPEFPQKSVHNDIRCVCPPCPDVHITDNMPGYTSTFSSTWAHPASSSPSEASCAARHPHASPLHDCPLQASTRRPPVVYRYGVHAGTASPHRTRAEPHLHPPLG